MIEKGICMADGKTGAIILAAGRSAHMEELKPMLRMGQTTMIQREIDTIRQAGISPIVVVTGYQADVLERHISHRGAVCIRNKRYETSQMYGSICMGLRHIQKKADRVLLFPADGAGKDTGRCRGDGAGARKHGSTGLSGKKRTPGHAVEGSVWTYLNVPGWKRTPRRNGCVGRRCPGD